MKMVRKFYKTEGIELRDAIFNMIMKLDEEQWYNPTDKYLY